MTIARKLGAQAVYIGDAGKPRKSAAVAKPSVRFDETVKLRGSAAAWL